MTRLRKLSTMAALAATFSLGVFGAASAQVLPKVGLFGSETGARLTNIVATITAEAAGVLEVHNRTGCSLATPTLVDLQQYEAVMVWSDCLFENSTTLGNVLADYVDGGGRVVLASHVWWQYTYSGTLTLDIRGRFASEGYNPIANGSSGVGGPTWSPVIVDQSTTLFDGVSNLAIVGIDNATTITPGSTLVAVARVGSNPPQYDHPLVAYKGNVVALNFFPASAAVQGGGWSGDGARLIVNALQFGNAPADSDGDGVSDATDNCPNDENPLQGDNDADSIGDVCDPDDDNDFVADLEDNCPIDANTTQDDSDFDGLGDACDVNFDNGSVVAAMELSASFAVDAIVASNVAGGNGMIAKLTGNGGVIKKINNAVGAYDAGAIDNATYLSELQGALDTLGAFDNQADAKISKNKIVDPEAGEILTTSAEIRAMIESLIVAAGG